MELVAGARDVGGITLMMGSKGTAATLNDITTAWTSVRQQVLDAGLQTASLQTNPRVVRYPTICGTESKLCARTGTGTGPQALATVRNTIVSVLRLAGHDNITAVLRPRSRNPHRPVDLPHEA